MSYRGKLLSMSGSVSVYVFVSVSASVLCPCLCLSVSVSVSVRSQEQEWRAGAGGEWQEGQACPNNKFSSQTKCFQSNKLVPLKCLSVGWLVGSLVGWLVGWLAGWLPGLLTFGPCTCSAGPRTCHLWAKF